MNNVQIFTDGSSRGNPGPGGWAAVVSVSGQVYELGGREKVTTNNRMELTACREALRFVSQKNLVETSGIQRVTIFTDSKYVKNGMESWVHGWVKNGWMTQAKEEVSNRDLWEDIISVSRGIRVEYSYIGGHIGVPGNERCDEIATSFADGKEPMLYSGSLENYSVDLTDLAGETMTQKKRATKKGGVAYSYLSVVDDKLMKHKTWKECEMRVKGVKGARFKKAMDQNEEMAIMKEWGFE